MNDRNWTMVANLDAWVRPRGHSLLELAFSWLASQPVVASVIAGASTAEQVRQNVAVVSWRLTPEELREVDRVTR